MAAGQSSSQIPGAVPAKPGILLVLSHVLDPAALAPADFADWYENTHVQEVQSTGGIAGSQRYEALSVAAVGNREEAPANRNLRYDFLTVYNMPDLAFRETEAFRGLDGQSEPRGELLEGLFRRVEFVTRFAEEVDVRGSGSEAAGAAPFVVTVSSLSGRAVPELDGVSGCRRSRGYKIHEGSKLSRFERSWLYEPTEMTIFEFEGLGAVAAVVDAVGEADGLEVGFWKLKRDYDGGERTPRGWSPRKAGEGL